MYAMTYLFEVILFYLLLVCTKLTGYCIVFNFFFFFFFSKCLGCVYVQRESKSSDFKGVSGIIYFSGTYGWL